MLSLSTTTGYAIRALACMSEVSTGHWVLARDIAEHTGIPRAYLAKILHALGKSGLVVAKRGYRGGFALARPASDISLLDVARAVEGKEGLTTCLLGLAECSDERACPTHAFWMEMRQRIEGELEQVTLREAAAFEIARGFAD